MLTEPAPARRYTYGLTYRPAGYGTVPSGRVATDDRRTARYFYGTVTYDRPLTAEECATYQLAPVEGEEDGRC